MSQQSSMHFYLNWTKERIDEMDVVLGFVKERSQPGAGRF